MGELVEGTPALRITTAVSLPLDVASVLSLLYRAVPGSGLDPWLIETRRALPDEVRANLDLLHGFSGRLLYYVEEPVMRFGPLDPAHRAATFDDLIAALETTPADGYLEMVAHALDRVRADLGLDRSAPLPSDEAEWRTALEPCLTTASMDDALALVANPEELKRRTVRLFRDVWDEVYRDEFVRSTPTLEAAARLGRAAARGNAESAFMDLTGHRPPEGVLDRVTDLRAVTFCPSMHLGNFVSYVSYPPDLVVFFDARSFLAREGEEPIPAPAVPAPSGALAPGELLEVARALADPSRLRILDMLLEDELYAQEIVGRLGIAQSAVSRHLSQLERATLVEVSARRGLKYYSINRRRFSLLAETFRQRAGNGKNGG